MKKNYVFESPYEQYTNIELIGAGGSGEVFKVKNKEHTIVALKLLRARGVSTEKIKRFKNEINLLRNFKNKNIVQILDEGYCIDGDQKRNFYVMPFYDKNLRSLINEGIKHEKVLSLFEQILDAIEYAHLKGCWHRDLKPENILTASASDQLILADFGIAHISEDLLVTEVETSHSAKLFNVQYAAPEQRKKGAKVDHRCDMYALGLILNELFTAEVPHGSNFKTINSVNGDFAYLDGIVQKLISQSPADRFQSVAELKVRLAVEQKKEASLQRLDKISNEVVGDETITDELYKNLPQIKDFDYDNGHLYANLTVWINSKWKQGFTTGSFSYSSMFHPSMVKFGDDYLTLNSSSDYASQAADMLREWVNSANIKYKQIIEEEHRRSNLNAKREYEMKIKAEKERLEVLKKLNPK